jgi:hypothetical protein
VNNLQTSVRQSLQTATALANNVIYKTYLEHLNNMDIVPCTVALQQAGINDIARFFKIECLVYAKNEKNRDSFKGSCFITSAALTALHKGDDCYELNAFRQFRDNWLANEPDGAKRVSGYPSR